MKSPNVGLEGMCPMYSKWNNKLVNTYLYASCREVIVCVFMHVKYEVQVNIMINKNECTLRFHSWYFFDQSLAVICSLKLKTCSESPGNLFLNECIKLLKSARVGLMYKDMLVLWVHGFQIDRNRLYKEGSNTGSVDQKTHALSAKKRCYQIRYHMCRYR